MSTGKYLRRLAAAVFTSAAVFGALLLASTVPSATVGVWNGSPGSVPAGARPDVMAYYLYYGSPFPSSFAAQAAAQLPALHAWHLRHLAHEARLRWLHMLYAG